MEGKTQGHKRESIASRVNRRRKAKKKDLEEPEDPELAKMFSEEQKEDETISTNLSINPP